MRNITRSKYIPKIGDYHNMIVHDPVWGKIWLFDCDGVFLDMSKTNVIVANEAGESEEFAISQKFTTDAINNLTSSINGVDEDSQIRDATIEAGLEQAVSELEAGIENATAEAIRRETQISNTLGTRINTLDRGFETLTTVTNNLTTLVATINRTAVFDVTVGTGSSLTLSVTDGSQTTTTTLREANASKNGLMSSEAYNQLVQNTEDIQHLQNAGLYRGSFEYLTDAPDHTPSAAFIGGEAYTNDFISVQNAEHAGETGIARYRILVESGAVTYNFEAFIDRDIANFTEGSPGLIVGGTADGEVGAQANGTGKVNGWDTLTGDVSDLQSDLSTLSDTVDGLSDDVSDIADDVSDLQGDMTTAQSDITNAQGDIADNALAISGNTSAISTINGKAVEATTQTTIGANSEALLTAAGMMNHWVDITQSGMPANPDANTFYYTVAS